VTLLHTALDYELAYSHVICNFNAMSPSLRDFYLGNFEYLGFSWSMVWLYMFPIGHFDEEELKLPVDMADHGQHLQFLQWMVTKRTSPGEIVND
jgi:hypothetical protein